MELGEMFRAELEQAKAEARTREKQAGRAQKAEAQRAVAEKVEARRAAAEAAKAAEQARLARAVKLSADRVRQLNGFQAEASRGRGWHLTQERTRLGS